MGTGGCRGFKPGQSLFTGCRLWEADFWAAFHRGGSVGGSVRAWGRDWAEGAVQRWPSELSPERQGPRAPGQGDWPQPGLGLRAWFQQWFVGTLVAVGSCPGPGRFVCLLSNTGVFLVRTGLWVCVSADVISLPL